jgi:uncharacterized protein YndB with AHSA1/START domain
MSALAHATLVMERSYPASPARVFAAWESAEARARWSAPTPEITIKYEQADFREGGRDVVRCIEAGKADFLAEVHYLDIRRDRHIVFAESVANGERRVSAALVSVEIAPQGARARLTLTLQIASFDGADMTAGYNEGWSAALDNLAREFRQEAP